MKRHCQCDILLDFDPKFDSKYIEFGLPLDEHLWNKSIFFYRTGGVCVYVNIDGDNIRSEYAFKTDYK